MTVIVGFSDKKNDILYMGADSRVSCTEGTLETLSYSKIFKKQVTVKISTPLKIKHKIEPMLIGVGDSVRLSQSLRYNFIPPFDHEEDPLAYMVSEFIPELAKHIKKLGEQYFDNDEGVKELYPQMIVGYKNRLFEIQADFQIGDYIKNFIAIGSGAPYARGFLEGDADSNQYNASDAILQSLRAASRCCLSVGPPYTVSFIKYSGEEVSSVYENITYPY